MAFHHNQADGAALHFGVTEQTLFHSSCIHPRPPSAHCTKSQSQHVDMNKHVKVVINDTKMHFIYPGDNKNKG